MSTLQVAGGFDGFTQRLEEYVIGNPSWKKIQGEAPVVVPQPGDNRVPSSFPAVSFAFRYTTSDDRALLQSVTQFFLLIQYWELASSDEDTNRAISNISRYRDAFAAAISGKDQRRLRLLRYQFSTSGPVEQVPRHPKVWRLSDQILCTVPR